MAVIRLDTTKQVQYVSKLGYLHSPNNEIVVYKDRNFAAESFSDASIQAVRVLRRSTDEERQPTATSREDPWNPAAGSPRSTWRVGPQRCGRCSPPCRSSPGRSPPGSSPPGRSHRRTSAEWSPSASRSRCGPPGSTATSAGRCSPPGATSSSSWGRGSGSPAGGTAWGTSRQVLSQRTIVSLSCLHCFNQFLGRVTHHPPGFAHEVKRLHVA